MIINLNNRISSYYKDIVMSNEILDILGISINNNEVNIPYEETIYDNYGLRIIKSDRNGLIIIFNNKVVLRNDNDNNFNYVPGKWEYILEQIYFKLKSIINKKNDKDKTNSKTHKLLNSISNIGSILLDNSIRIEERDCFDKDNKYKGTTYEVYEKDELVFKGLIFMPNEKIIKYIPGNWEKEIIKYEGFILDIKRQQYLEYNNKTRYLANY